MQITFAHVETLSEIEHKLVPEILFIFCVKEYNRNCKFNNHISKWQELTQLNRCVNYLNKLCKILHNPCETYEPTNSCVKSYTTLVV